MSGSVRARTMEGKDNRGELFPLMGTNQSFQAIKKMRNSHGLFQTLILLDSPC